MKPAWPLHFSATFLCHDFARNESKHTSGNYEYNTSKSCLLEKEEILGRIGKGKESGRKGMGEAGIRGWENSKTQRRDLIPWNTAGAYVVSQGRPCTNLGQH